MFNVCRGCGEYEPKRIFAKIDGQTSMICTVCETLDYVTQKPLLVVTGASGTGKTTLAQQLVGVLQGIFVFEIDILWNPYFHEEFKNKQSIDKFLSHWLRVAKNINYNGVQAVAFGSSTPDQILSQSEARYFSDFHFLALTTEAEIIRKRLITQPALRETVTDDFINSMLEFNTILEKYMPKNPKITSYTKLNTNQMSVDETISEVIIWIERYGKLTNTLQT